MLLKEPHSLQLQKFQLTDVSAEKQTWSSARAVHASNSRAISSACH